MKNNNIKTNFYTQGQRLAARVLFIVWLLASFGLQSTLADGITLYRVVASFAFGALLSAPGSSLKTLQESLQSPVPAPAEDLSLDVEDTCDEYFDNHKDVKIQDLWGSLKNDKEQYENCDIVFNLDKCKELNDQAANKLFECLQQNKPFPVASIVLAGRLSWTNRDVSENPEDCPKHHPCLSIEKEIQLVNERIEVIQDRLSSGTPETPEESAQLEQKLVYAQSARVRLEDLLPPT